MREYSSNTHGVKGVLECAAATDSLQRAIFASSRLVCALGERPVCDYDYCPPNYYGRSKVIGEQLVRAHEHKSSWAIVRPTSIWGPWGGAPYRDFFLSLARGTYVHPGRERIKKHYGYVGNVVFQLDRLLMAPEERVHGRTFYIADFEPTEVLAFATAIRRQLGLPAPRSAPVPLLKLLARSMDTMKAAGMPEPPLTSSRLNNLRTPMLFDLDEVADVVGRLPFTLEQGVSATIAHLESQGDIRREKEPAPQ
jgi:nucleoside-diphosphate-sugar epimerase